MQSFLLTAIEQLTPINAHDKSVYAQHFKIKQFAKGEFFLREGQICKQIGITESGLMRHYINQNGEERTYNFIQEQRFLCNYESFISQTASLTNIQALEDCTVHLVSYDDLEYLYANTESGNRIGRLVLGRVLIKMEKDLTSFYTDTPEQRYRKFIDEYPDLQNRISQYHIASYVGVKPPSLSRIRNRFLKNS